MARLPLPQRGQPIDTSYIYQIVNAINDLSAVSVSPTYKYVTIDTPTGGKQSVKTSEAKIIGAYVDVINSSVTSGTTEVTKTYRYSDFASPPIVTATIVNAGNTEAGNSASVFINSITASEVVFKVRFSKTGNASVGVTLTILGIPV
jgi:hypothetical protein